MLAVAARLWFAFIILGNPVTFGQAVVMGSDLEFRIAPSAGAQAIARAPAGTIVRVDAADREWIRASAGQREGWVPRAALARVEDGR